jgi:hypothetical protein
MCCEFPKIYEQLCKLLLSSESCYELLENEKEANSCMLNIIPGNCPVLRFDIIIIFRSWDTQCVNREKLSAPCPTPSLEDQVSVLMTPRDMVA